MQLRSWDWLLALKSRFQIEIQIVDEHLAPALPLSYDDGAHLDELIGTRAGALQTAVTAARRTTLPQPLVVGALQCVCFALSAQDTAGALLIARHTASTAEHDAVRVVLESLGGWMCMAIEAHMSSPGADATDVLHRLSTLHRLLGDVAEAGTDRQLVARFADILALWHDVHVYGYVDAGTGGYVRDASPPREIDPPRPELPASLVDGLDPLRLSVEDNLQIDEERECLLVRIPVSVGGRSWVLCIDGSVPPEERSTLQVAVEMLASRLAQASTRADVRIRRRIEEVLNSHTAVLAEVSVQTVNAVRSEMGEDVGLRLTIRDPGGACVLSLPAGDQAGDPPFVVRRHTAGGFAVAWSAAPAGVRLTPQQMHLLDTAADLFGTWVDRRAPPGAATRDRRRSQRPFDDMLQQSATQLLRSGSPVAALVLAATEGRNAIHEDVRHLRSVLRPMDIVGVTGAGDIGVLLADVRRDEAEAVAARLVVLLHSADAAEGRSRVRIGICAPSPGEPATALVEQARQQAYSPSGRN